MKAKKQVSFETTKDENKIIRKITRRVNKLQRHAIKAGFLPPDASDVTCIIMDVVAAHCNGCPLRLEKLAAADDYNFVHDVYGIHGHIDRTTGHLRRSFLPRFAVPRTVEIKKRRPA